MRNLNVFCIIGVIFISLSTNGSQATKSQTGISFGDLKELFVAVDKIVDNPDEFFDKVKQELEKENITVRSLNFPKAPNVLEDYPDTPQLRFLGIGSIFNKIKDAVSGIFNFGGSVIPVETIKNVVKRVLIILLGPYTKANITGLAHIISYVISFVLNIFF
ncbi:uncharacterized protein [Diabrotica undecimpunctata]|uniref:uncharacterized protein isoform X2 n=1 Tax=Diabrotica undecimpunctata TaxID=50387 RepID=UPI003B63BECC